jgi:hypothetical protein
MSRCVNSNAAALILRPMLARAILSSVLLGASMPAPAGPGASPVVTEVTPTAEASVSPVALVTVPAFTPVYLRIDAELSSKKQKNGDRFPILIVEDVRVGGAVVIPAGSAGEGEVIHAAKSGMGGKAGELLITARFVRAGGREIRLRSFSLGATGRDRADNSLALSVVTGPLGLFVVGGVVIIPRGTVAGAKTAEEIQLPIEQRPVESTKGGEEHETIN